MSKFKKIRNLYKISATVVLILAVLLTAFFLAKGLQAKNKRQDINSQNTNSSKTDIEKDQDDAPSSQDPILISKKINLSVPIKMNIDGNNAKSYNNALENGVAHLMGSASPGKYGNVFIFGHSSYDAEKPGRYKEVFSKLNELVNGDLLEIQNQNALYLYKVVDKKIVKPDDVSVAGQNLSLKQLTLMTCWPIGSTEKRLVVVGELVE